MRLQFATSSWGGRRKLPLAFTEHGAIMAATVLDTPRAVEVSVVVRAFVKLREMSRMLDDLERKTKALAMINTHPEPTGTVWTNDPECCGVINASTALGTLGCLNCSPALVSDAMPSP